MSQDLASDALAAQLRADHFVDVTAMLKPGGRAEILTEIEQWKARGLLAHVLVARGMPTSVLGETWTALHADPRVDLVLFFNGKEWDARGWGLESSRIKAALTAAEPALRQYHGKGIAEALRQLGRAAIGGPSTGVTVEAASHSTAPHESGSAVGVTSAGVAALLAVSGLAFILSRRSKLAAEARAAFNDARTSAERAYAELILAAEEVGADGGRDLQLKASDIKTRLDAVIASASDKPQKMSDPVTLGKIRQFEDELAALKSTNLQRARRVANVEVKDHRGPSELGDAEDDGAAGVDAVALRRTDRSS